MNVRRVGYWMSEKKIRKLSFWEFHEYCRKAGIELVKIDLQRPLDEQGPFDVIFHKLTDHIARAQEGDVQARHYIQQFVLYLSRHPYTVMLDPLEKVYQLLDRNQQYQLIQGGKAAGQLYFIPNFVDLKTDDVELNARLLRQNKVNFPIVCKPLVAHGSRSCHEMSIVFHEGGLKDITPGCVAQSFIPHNALLYKVFAIGDQYYIIERPSLKNFAEGDQETIFFDSHDVSKADSSSFLTELDQDEMTYPHFQVNQEQLRMIAQDLQQRLGLLLFGIDVIIHNKDGRYAVIDINTFPGYDGVADFFPALLNLIQKSMDQSEQAKQTFLRGQSPPANQEKDLTKSALPETEMNQSKLAAQVLSNMPGHRLNGVRASFPVRQDPSLHDSAHSVR